MIRPPSWLLPAAVAIAVGRPAYGAMLFEPSAHTGARGTDNAGDRPDVYGPRPDATTTAALGGRLVHSGPIGSLRLEGLGEWERYLSARVSNTRGEGVLDARWRPDERTYLRSTSRGSYAPDRYDPRVPYRLALLSDPGREIPPFVRATMVRWSEALLADHRLTEAHHLRAIAAVTDTRFSGRRLADATGSSIDAVVLQGRSVWELFGESLWAAREELDAGIYAEGTRADYEVTEEAWSAGAGGVLDWKVAEVMSLRARVGPSWTTVPRAESIPDRWGGTADVALLRRWPRVEVELLAREGMFLAEATIPAARSREGRVTVRTTPLERLTFDAWGAAGLERSLYEAYHATGTARALTAGAALGWQFAERLVLRAGYELAEVKTTGRSALPYTSHVVHVGLTFTGWRLGGPAPEASP